MPTETSAIAVCLAASPDSAGGGTTAFQDQILIAKCLVSTVQLTETLKVRSVRISPSRFELGAVPRSSSTTYRSAALHSGCTWNGDHTWRVC